jgi:hypothetical protein
MGDLLNPRSPINKKIGLLNGITFIEPRILMTINLSNPNSLG